MEDICLEEVAWKARVSISSITQHLTIRLKFDNMFCVDVDYGRKLTNPSNISGHCVTTRTRIRRVTWYMCTEIEVRASPPKAQRRVEEETPPRRQQH